MNNNSITRFLRQKMINRKGLLVLGILCILLLSVVAYRLEIDRDQLLQLVRTYGFLGIFILMLVSSMTILVPLPGWAILALAPGIMGLSGGGLFLLGVVATTGATLGETTGYLAGYWGRAAITEKHQRDYGRAERWMRRYGSAAIFFIAIMPFPFDLVGIAAGSLRFPLWKFLVFSWPGRLIRTMILIYLGWGLFELAPVVC